MRSPKTCGGVRNFMTDVSAYDKWVLCCPFPAKFVERLLDMDDLGSDCSKT